MTITMTDGEHSMANNIVRIDNPTQRTHGYQARRGTGDVTPAGYAKYRSKLFSDRKCGGQRRAYQAAKHWVMTGSVPHWLAASLAALKVGKP